MSGPGGSTTKRDQRRENRREQFRQRQVERQRERERRIRQQRLRRGALWGGGILIVAVIIGLVVHAATSGSQQPGKVITGTGTYTTPPNGQTRDGMSCMTTEGTALHIHSYLEIYVNGQPVTVPPGTGIVGNSCLYPLHVHDGEPGIIHVESPVQATYTLGAFFDIWGQPLSKTRVMQYTADASHPLVFEVFDANGHLSKVMGDPLSVPLQAHETIVILYNSPNVQPKPYTNWTGL
jgi:hypothetical protein